MRNKPIYVESLIDNPVEEIWARTQTPEVHKRWDVRFTDISYIQRAEDDPGPQRFVYSTTVAPGLSVDGRGETIGERHRLDGTAYSGLKFWSDHPLSLIKEGAGYWRYVPTENGVRFLTRYDYRVRWGAFGRLIDRFVFRPIFGWATAWSFDRLRLWIEHDIDPRRSRNKTLTHWASIVALVLLWANQGPVPNPGPTGLAMMVLAVVALLTARNLPSGRRPLRTPPPGTSSPTYTPSTRLGTRLGTRPSNRPGLRVTARTAGEIAGRQTA